MRVAVVGGGIAGLAAAWELTTGTEPVEVTVFEPGPLGGRIQTETFLGHRVDTGADAFVARVPDALTLARELGLESELVAPAARKALIWVGGQLHPLPDGLVLGAPAQLGPLLRSGILSPTGVLRAGLDLVLPRTHWPDDVSVAELVGRRFGAQVAQRLVDPLLGGIHAGRTEDLSADSTAPQLARAARTHRSLLLGLRALPAPAAGPLFLAPRDGMGRLVSRLVEALRERGVVFDRTRVGVVSRGEGTAAGDLPSRKDPARGLPSRADPAGGLPSRADPASGLPSRADPAGGVRGKGGPVVLDPGGAFDAAVVATPAGVTAELVENACPEAAANLRAIRWSSVVLATLAYRRADLAVPDGASGLLVARGEGRLMTACSFGSDKWPHWSDADTMVLRVSAGRAGDERALQLSDADLVDQLQHEVALALGTTAAPFDWRVNQWREAFPQYEIGHGARITRIDSALRQSLPGVALAGASLRGSGVPACIASGRQAARSLTGRGSGT